jgi:hypothetical protein
MSHLQHARCCWYAQPLVSNPATFSRKASKLRVHELLICQLLVQCGRLMPRPNLTPPHPTNVHTPLPLAVVAGTTEDPDMPLGADSIEAEHGCLLQGTDLQVRLTCAVG